jgi:hypothetical protein
MADPKRGRHAWTKHAAIVAVRVGSEACISIGTWPSGAFQIGGLAVYDAKHCGCHLARQDLR